MADAQAEDGHGVMSALRRTLRATTVSLGMPRRWRCGRNRGLILHRIGTHGAQVVTDDPGDSEGDGRKVACAGASHGSTIGQGPDTGSLPTKPRTSSCQPGGVPMPITEVRMTWSGQRSRYRAAGKDKGEEQTEGRSAARQSGVPSRPGQSWLDVPAGGAEGRREPLQVAAVLNEEESLRPC